MKESLKSVQYLRRLALTNNLTLPLYNVCIDYFFDCKTLFHLCKVNLLLSESTTGRILFFNGILCKARASSLNTNQRRIQGDTTGCLLQEIEPSELNTNSRIGT